MKEMAKAVPDGRPNMIALGIAARLLGFDCRAAVRAGREAARRQGQAAIEASRAAIKVGFEAAAGLEFEQRSPPPKPITAQRWLMSGNEATALGAIRGGIRFAAAYPITPATEILEWLAPNLAKVGGVLLQAEDELAAINMIIGASYGGTPSLTATSGPGLSLMIEALGLATAAEIPIVVVDVMRGGPSTGIPTKSEQADLNIAVYGLHGDAPHLVLAPQSVADCLFTTQWATYLAEALQAPAIVLSDQFIGPGARRHRAAGRRRLHRRARARPKSPAPTSATPWRPTACRRWRFPARAAANTPPTASPTPRTRHPDQRRRRSSRRSSTSAATSSTASTTATTGRRSKATAISRC